MFEDFHRRGEIDLDEVIRADDLLRFLPHGFVRGDATVFPQSIGLAASWDTTLMSNVANAIAIETKMRGVRQVLSPVINIASDVRWGRTEETYGEDPFLSSAMAVSYVRAFEKTGSLPHPNILSQMWGMEAEIAIPFILMKDF